MATMRATGQSITSSAVIAPRPTYQATLPRLGRPSLVATSGNPWPAALCGWRHREPQLLGIAVGAWPPFEAGSAGGDSPGESPARDAAAAVSWSPSCIAPAMAFTVPLRSASRTRLERSAEPAATAIPSGGEMAAVIAAAATWISVSGERRLPVVSESSIRLNVLRSSIRFACKG